MKLHSTKSQTTRKRWPKAVLALFIMMSVLVPASSDADAAAPAITDCSYESSRLMGWIWADGKYNKDKGHYFFRTLSPSISRHIKQVMRELDVSFKTGNSRRGHDNYRIKLPGMGGASIIYSDMSDHPLVKCNPEAFLASVIETEGSQSGKVMDDPMQVRRTGAQEVLDDIDVGSQRQRQNVTADRSDWSNFRDLPFVACGRVPGGSSNCTLGLTGY